MRHDSTVADLSAERSVRARNRETLNSTAQNIAISVRCILDDTEARVDAVLLRLSARCCAGMPLVDAIRYANAEIVGIRVDARQRFRDLFRPLDEAA